MSSPEPTRTDPEESPSSESHRYPSGTSGALLTETHRRGFVWTLVAVSALGIRCMIPEVYPQWFVDESGQITVRLGWIGGLVVAGLLWGRWWMRPVALVYFVVGFIGAIPIVSRLLSAQPNFINDHAVGYALLLALDAAAFGIIAFAPSVRERFAQHSRQDAAS